MLQLHRVRAIEGIYGFPAKHPAHRADIVRLAALISMGGVYLDTDVLVLKSFDMLGNPDFAAAWEFTGEGRLVGLSNAVLVAAKQSCFARLCLEGHDPKRSLWSGFRLVPDCCSRIASGDFPVGGLERHGIGPTFRAGCRTA